MYEKRYRQTVNVTSATEGRGLFKIKFNCKKTASLSPFPQKVEILQPSSRKIYPPNLLPEENNKLPIIKKALFSHPL